MLPSDTASWTSVSSASCSKPFHFFVVPTRQSVDSNMPAAGGELCALSSALPGGRACHTNAVPQSLQPPHPQASLPPPLLQQALPHADCKHSSFMMPSAWGLLGGSAWDGGCCGLWSTAWPAQGPRNTARPTPRGGLCQPTAQKPDPTHTPHRRRATEEAKPPRGPAGHQVCPAYLGGHDAEAHSVLLLQGHSDDFRFFPQRLGLKDEHRGLLYGWNTISFILYMTFIYSRKGFFYGFYMLIEDPASRSHPLW